MKLPWKPRDPPALDNDVSELADLWWPYAEGREILVIDDHPPYLSYLETLLRTASYEVISAYQPGEAVQRARDEKPDVIVMDQKLPALRGFRALNKLVEDPATAGIPVIMVYLRDPGNFSWRRGDEAVAHLSRAPDALLDMLRRLDLAALAMREASQGIRPDASEQPPNTAPRDDRPKRILVVDDEPHVVRFMEKRLREADYEVISCFDGREAAQKARAELPDAIVLDMSMPFIHWLTVFSELKTAPSTGDIPVILLDTPHPGVFRSLWIPPNSSAATFLVKPFSPDQLLTAVAAALERGASGPLSSQETS
jgi:CheY-like chemotaxis protein